MVLERKEWMRALTAHEAVEIHGLAERLVQGCEVRHQSLPQAGLGLLTLSDGAFNEPYYLGEFPLSISCIELHLSNGQRAQGGAQVMVDDADLARSLAILDAVLASRLPGWEEAADLIRTGEEKRREQAQRRNRILTSTRVDFSLLGTVDKGDEDNA
ncbi:MAG: phosphonate C-P lyase system protein PhnG [Candidatus Thiodiazotropha sp.]|jgi:alpha-D-ribose 1-methylphosphonate 5-triphosphate synthase subunit PhnG